MAGCLITPPHYDCSAFTSLSKFRPRWNIQIERRSCARSCKEREKRVKANSPFLRPSSSGRLLRKERGEDTNSRAEAEKKREDSHQPQNQVLFPTCIRRSSVSRCFPTIPGIVMDASTSCWMAGRLFVYYLSSLLTARMQIDDPRALVLGRKRSITRETVEYNHNAPFALHAWAFLARFSSLRMLRKSSSSWPAREEIATEEDSRRILSLSSRVHHRNGPGVVASSTRSFWGITANFYVTSKKGQVGNRDLALFPFLVLPIHLSFFPPSPWPLPPPKDLRSRPALQAPAAALPRPDGAMKTRQRWESILSLYFHSFCCDQLPSKRTKVVGIEKENHQADDADDWEDQESSGDEEDDEAPKSRSKGKGRAVSKPAKGAAKARGTKRRSAASVPVASTSKRKRAEVESDEDGDDDWDANDEEDESAGEDEPEEDEDDEGACKKVPRKKKQKIEKPTSSDKDAVNAKRREQNVAKAKVNPEIAEAKRWAKGQERTDVIVRVWGSVFNHHVASKTGVVDCVDRSQHLSARELVQATVNAYFVREGHEQIPATEAVWKEFPDPVMEMFGAIVKDPSGWDPRPFIKDKILVESKADGPSPVNKCAHYIRLIRLRTEEVFRALRAYLDAYPAEAPSTVIRLLLLGEDLADVFRDFTATMKVFGLEDAIAQFCKHVEENAGATVLRGARRAGKQITLGYTGISAVKAPGARVVDDILNRSPVFIINFLKSNPELESKIVTYDIPDIAVNVPDERAVRTTPRISQQERIIRAMLGPTALNSAPGGVQPIFLVPPEITRYLDALRELLPADLFPFGQEENHDLSERLSAFIDDELETLTGPTNSEPSNTLCISDSALAQVKSNIADVVRLCKGEVGTVEIIKDINLEAMIGEAGYWPSRRPSSSPSLLSQHPDDGHPFHRYSRAVRWPSTPVAAALKARHLVEVWTYFGDDGHAAFMDGVSPPDFRRRFPRGRGPSLQGAQFNDMVGEMCIVRFGPNTAHIAIWIVKLHFGSFKYDPVLAGPRWTVMCHTRAVEETAQRVVSTALRNSPPDLQDPSTRETWLNTCIEEARRLLAKDGVLENLQKAKAVLRDMEQTYGFLRSIISAKTMHDRWLESEDRGGMDRPRGELTAPKGEARQAQMERLLAKHNDAISFGGFPLYGNYRYPMGTLAWQTRFLCLDDDVDIVRSANTRGRSAEANDRVKARIAAFIDRLLKNNPGVHRIYFWEHIEELIKDAAKLDKFKCGISLASPRVTTCEGCGSTVFTRNTNGTHQCVGSTEGPWPITVENFPTVERPLYVHDMLRRPDIRSHFSLNALNLVEIRVQDIIDASWYDDELEAALVDFPLDYEAISAIDEDFVAGLPSVWKSKTSANLMRVMKKDRETVFMVVCRGAPGTGNRAHFFLAAGVTKKGAGTGRGNKDYALPKARNCTICDGDGPRISDCEYRLYQKVNTILDLPPLYSRHWWLDLRREIDWDVQTQDDKARRAATGKKPKAAPSDNSRYRPGNSNTPKNLFGKEWVKTQRGATRGRFKAAWASLPESEIEKWNERSKAAKRK
ncbi:hypothetical protein FB45DRAFT_875544 [Roridomyces roridus]|uniref:Uncharacterized protein n=1 Tax=Roridomyces roridus TaxID=1738132 RepID=A0AAD7B5L0_9AGAR|nr:hypothetical protein FB45DRAFT_875544 [Roridomyces roridus]